MDAQDAPNIPRIFEENFGEIHDRLNFLKVFVGNIR